MGLDEKIANGEMAVMTTKLDPELAKMEYEEVHSSEKKKNKGSKSEGTNSDSKVLVLPNANNKKTVNAIEAVKLAVTTKGSKLFEHYGNLLTDETRQPWKSIIKA